MPGQGQGGEQAAIATGMRDSSTSVPPPVYPHATTHSVSLKCHELHQK